MNILKNKRIWIGAVAAILLAALFFFVLHISGGIGSPIRTEIPTLLIPDEPAETPVPVETAAPAATSEPLVTDAPTPELTAEPGPTPVTYLLTFTGDCTLGSQNGSEASYTFQGVVGEDYGWPFRLVQDYFANDTMTLVNLEGTFTTYGGRSNKTFTFRADPRFAACLTEGSVEAVSVANNHSEDFGHQGFSDTMDTLDKIGIKAATFTDPLVFTTEDGFKIGVIAGYYPSVDGLKKQYDACMEDKCDIVIAAIHMGNEYYYHPTGGQKSIAHACIDMGCCAVIMHHPHVLQPIEYYKEKPIAYSLGNFSFGGNVNPRDRDTAILQLPVIRDPEGTVTLGELKIIPCCLSSGPRNNYQPIPLKEDDPAYARILSKLDGTYAVNDIALHPDKTEAPEETPEPIVTLKPSRTPKKTPEPSDVTPKPTASGSDPTQRPSETAEPKPTPGPTQKPDETETPEDTQTPQDPDPTQAPPEPTQAPPAETTPPGGGEDPDPGPGGGGDDSGSEDGNEG